MAKVFSNQADSVSCLDYWILVWWSLCTCSPLYINCHPKNKKFLIFFCNIEQFRPSQSRCLHLKNYSMTKCVFLPKVWRFGGFWGHILHMSNVLSCVFKFYRTGHGMVPTKSTFFQYFVWLYSPNNTDGIFSMKKMITHVIMYTTHKNCHIFINSSRFYNDWQTRVWRRWGKRV